MPHTQRFILLLIAVIVGSGVLVSAFSAVREKSEDNRLSVTAEGSVFAAPDIGEITLGVNTRGADTAASATEKNIVVMNRVTDAVKAEDVEARDIKTIAYNLYPQYDYTPDRGQELTGWTLEQMVRVKVRNLDAIGAVIAAATNAGANQAGGIAFTIDDTDTLKAEARTAAIEKAKEKAKAIAKAAGVKLGDVVTVYESEPNGDVFYPQMDAAIGRGGAATPQVERGENEVVVSVTLVYETK